VLGYKGPLGQVQGPSDWGTGGPRVGYRGPVGHDRGTLRSGYKVPLGWSTGDPLVGSGVSEQKCK